MLKYTIKNYFILGRLNNVILERQEAIIYYPDKITYIKKTNYYK